MKASRDDLSYVMVQVVDQNGQLVPDAVVPVSFSIAGAAGIAAVTCVPLTNVVVCGAPFRLVTENRHIM